MSNIKDFIAPMPGEAADFDADMEGMARHIIQEAQKDGVKLSDKIEAFKAIQPYHAARERYKGKQAEPETGKKRNSFTEFRKAAGQE